MPTVQRKCAACEAESSKIQPRLEVGPAGDRYEMEADTIAAQVMAMRNPGAGKALVAGGTVQARAANGETGESIAATEAELTGGGSQLPANTRGFFEWRMGRDLSDVRVHGGAEASGLNASIQARAFTYKNHVWLGGGERAEPSFTMAHELAHVMQQTAPGRVGPGVQRLPEVRAAPPAVQRDGMGDVKLAEGREELRQQQQHEQRLGILPMLLRWKAAGLLDSPFRPAEVGEVPPMQFSAERAKEMDVRLAGLPALAYVAQEAGKAALTKPGPTLTVLRGGLGAAVEAGAAVEVGTGAAATGLAETGAASGLSRAAGLLGRATPWAIAAGILLTSTETAPPWMVELSPITGRPYASPEEYQWTWRLDQAQRRYLDELWRRRNDQPNTSLDSAPDIEPTLQPNPKPKTKEDPKAPNCISNEVPRLGGHKRHDAYAEKVTGSKFDFFAMSRRPPPPLSINYDGKTANTALVWEVKVGHGWFFNPAKAALRDLTLAKWDAQAARGLVVAINCGFAHFWSVPDRSIAMASGQSIIFQATLS